MRSAWPSSTTTAAWPWAPASQRSCGLDLALAAAGYTDIVRATRRALDTLNLGAEEVEDILVALTGQYHLIRPLTRTGGSSLFLYLVLDRTRANLAMARHHLRRIEATLEL